MIKRLRLKFICINMALVTVMLLMILAVQYHTTRVGLEKDSLKVLQSTSREQHLPGLGSPGQNQPCFVLRMAQNEVVAMGDGYYDLSDYDWLRSILTAAITDGQQTGVLQEYALRYLRTDTFYGYQFVFTDITAEQQTLSRLLRNCLLIGGAAFLGFLGISILLALWAVKPVETAWQQQRQFVADASHELKTPLTVILTNAELLQAPEYDEEARQHFSENILTMSRQMRGLVESLLELARVDNGQVRTMMGTVDYSKLVSDAVLPFEPVYFERGLTLESRVEPGLSVTGSEQHLRQVVEILLDNGQKYAAAGGCVTLSLSRQSHGQCLLEVSSPGRELSPEECKNVFKRFYRVDPARSMNHSYGLGLSIARQIVGDHRGKIWAEGKAGRNTFFVSLPLKNLGISGSNS